LLADQHADGTNELIDTIVQFCIFGAARSGLGFKSGD